MKEEAEKRIKYRYLLKEIIKVEKIKVTDKDAKARVKEMAKMYNVTEEEILKEVSLENVKFDGNNCVSNGGAVYVDSKPLEVQVDVKDNYYIKVTSSRDAADIYSYEIWLNQQLVSFRVYIQNKHFLEHIRLLSELLHLQSQMAH